MASTISPAARKDTGMASEQEWDYLAEDWKYADGEPMRGLSTISEHVCAQCGKALSLADYFLSRWGVCMACTQKNHAKAVEGKVR